MARPYIMPKKPEEGNSSVYDPENLIPETSVLSGRTFAMLGSSITYGYGSGGISFADMIAAIDQCRVIKQAISGSTLAYCPERPETEPQDCYVRQLMDHIDRNEKIDAFVVQLSTNDAQKGIPMGEITDSKSPEWQHRGTITGAMEYILAYIEENWHCPVVFYTNARLTRESIERFTEAHPEVPVPAEEGCQYLIDNYEEMISRLYELQKKWHFEIADLWNSEITHVSADERELMMSDVIHPMKSGYLFWYVPAIEASLKKVLCE